MPNVGVLDAVGALARLTAPSLGVFRGDDAQRLGIDRSRLARLRRHGVIVREHPDVYRMAAIPPSAEQRLRAALAWAGPTAAAAGRSAARLYGLEGIVDRQAEIVVPSGLRARREGITVHHAQDRRMLMVRDHQGIPVTGMEATLMLLAHLGDDEDLELACEDARRRRLTSMVALDKYVGRWKQRGRLGLRSLRALLDQLDPQHPSRSKLEVLTRRLLVARGLGDFTGEHPLTDGGRRYLYDFAFVRERVILEVNGRRWHDDPADFEADQRKWSVPARQGFRLVLATWRRVTEEPDQLVGEIRAALAA